MAKFTWSETFLSIEGEGSCDYAGSGTLYARFTNCNFTCRGFNNPDMKEITNEVLGFDPKKISTVQEIEEINIGCDSIYAWDSRFKHMWKTGTEDDLIDELESLTPTGTLYAKNGKPYIFSATGGEPSLRLKTLPTLFNHPRMDPINIIIFETNCSVDLKQEHIDKLNEWANVRPERKIVWSNSPKLQISGHSRKEAIRPSVALAQRQMNPDNFTQYFKFVSDGSDEGFNEIRSVMEEYYDVGIPKDVNVYVMPMACTEEQQRTIMRTVADKCIEEGYIYCHRIHNTVYENAIGK